MPDPEADQNDQDANENDQDANENDQNDGDLDECFDDDLSDAEFAELYGGRDPTVPRPRPAAPPPRERPAHERLPDAPDPETCRVAPGRVGDLLRALRWSAMLSQRELAVRAGVPRSTLSLLESDQGKNADPRLSTVQRLVESIGLHLVVAADDGTLLSLPAEQSAYRDGVARHLPAHLRNRAPDDSWHGWGLLGHVSSTQPAPDRIYHQSRRLKRPWDFDT